VALLEVRNLTMQFGGLSAISGVDLDVCEGEILGLIGPNGAGKSTFYNVVHGVFRPTEGRISFGGVDIVSLAMHERARLGISRTFQDNMLFMDLTVLDNVFAGFHMRYNTRLWKAFLHSRSAREEDRAKRKNALEILEFMGLLDRKDELARNLPHGYQRILGICIALAPSPRLLLLDEPATGMDAEEAQTLIGLIRALRDKGITVMIVEHNIGAIMSVCDRIVVLNFGKKLAEGLPEEIRTNSSVVESYIGSRTHR
jgi:branched-chain amino acid transport system ATP-binding protein